jgi:hypothetical protein
MTLTLFAPIRAYFRWRGCVIGVWEQDFRRLGSFCPVHENPALGRARFFDPAA